ncbi:MAG TPA: M3 family oligoendopeptidase [Thermomicrobiales bacterium]|nr:M3 family oligoendopeptidase [Thermomicrobiales bacterium]
MTARPLPDSPRAFADATWDDIVPYYDELAARPLDRDNADAWLRDWSALDELLAEAQALANIAYTTDTADPQKEAAHLRFAAEIGPRAQEQRVRLSARLLDLGYERPDLTVPLRKFRNQRDLFREENLPLTAEVQRLNARYRKITGGMTVEWDGVEKPLPQLAPYLLSPDRAVRERAFRLRAQPYLAARDELADIFDRQFALREQIARNAGFATYRDYAHQERNRFDYTPDDCLRFHDAVEQTVTPAVERLYGRRRLRMGLDTLRPWDTSGDPAGRPPLHPYDGTTELVGGAARIFERVDPPLGGYFQTMAGEHLLDLESRKGKAPGGYCTSLPHRRRPFIFMNASGVAGDVRTLLHESGHAFHGFESYAQPLIWQRHPGSEMAEVASMSMELLSAPYLERDEGGFYAPEDARRARREHLEGILTLLGHIAAVDAFQQWIYTSGEGADRDARDAAWLRLRQRFERGIDWSGLEAERVARWYQQLHIFLIPFYYIEYGIAQLGALQVWRNALRDQPAAVAAYRRALALGGTRPLPDLFTAAGARLAFDAATMGELVALVEDQLATLERGA